MSSLLHLPAEIRNRIYEYTLTDPAGIHICWHATRNRRKKKPVTLINNASIDEHAYPINEMKYVCKQLYRETAGLGILYNVIAFPQCAQDLRRGRSGFFHFVEWCTPNVLCWLKQVILEEDAYESLVGHGMIQSVRSEVLRQIANLLVFCDEHPQITVDLRVPYFQNLEDPTHIVQAGLFLLQVFRGIDKWDKAPVFNADLTTVTVLRRLSPRVLQNAFAGTLQERIEERYGRVSNLRFFPMRQGMKFDKHRWLELCADTWWYKRHNLGSEDMVEWMQWSKVGMIMSYRFELQAGSWAE